MERTIINIEAAREQLEATGRLENKIVIPDDDEKLTLYLSRSNDPDEISVELTDCEFRCSIECYDEISSLEIRDCSFLKEVYIEPHEFFCKYTFKNVTFHEYFGFTLLSSNAKIYPEVNNDRHPREVDLSLLNINFLGCVQLLIELEQEVALHFAIETNRRNSELLHRAAPHIRQVIHP